MKKNSSFFKVLIGLFLSVCLLGVSSLTFAGELQRKLVQESAIEKIMRKGEMKIGIGIFVPWSFKDINGKLTGFEVDVAKKVAKDMGVKAKFVPTEWSGIIPSLLTGKFDVIIGGMTVTQSRNLQINFTNPYIVVGQAVLLNIKHKGKVKSYKDLNDPKYTIVSRLGTTGEQAAMKMLPRAKYKSFEAEAEAAMEVIAGNADALIYDLPFIEKVQAQHGAGKTIALSTPFTYEPLAMAIRKGDPDFMNYLNNFLFQYKGDGLWQRSYNKWFKSTDWFDKVGE